ncbi:MAG: hypothetical protein FWC41_05815 [Firmicutes bacterium]|nr:hypothetical protein [Bacillota bacterium]
MKAKTLFITIFLTLQIQFLLSQCISIELSITWEKEYHIYYKDSMVNIPKLNITYRNNCDSNYYFLKVTNNQDSLLNFICTLTIGGSSFEKPDYHALMNYNAKKYVNQNFNVSIGANCLYYGGIGKVSPDPLDISKAHLPDIINCRLNAFTEYIRYDKNSNDLSWRYKLGGPIEIDFETSNMFPKNILDAVSDQFVFLKSGETYIDIFNLVAFQIVEGCYTFFIAQDMIENYVLTTQHDSKMKKNVEKKFKLLAIVGEYQLYFGTFNSNKVTVCFGERY